MWIDSYLEHTNLRAIQELLCLTGVLLAVYLMQLVWHNPEEGGLKLRWARRINLALVAFGMLWSLSYGDERGWQPWPAELLLLFTVNSMMLIRILVIHSMVRRGAKIWPPYPRTGIVRRPGVG